MTPAATTRAIARLHATRRMRRRGDPMRALVACVVVAALACALHVLRAH